eukprot:1821836-Alexandrium_andersonii.AAC.1
MDVGEFLLRESHHVLRERRAANVERLQREQGAGGKRMRGNKWVERQHSANSHVDTGAISASSWMPALASIYPDFALLPPREMCLLDAKRIRYPDSRRMFINISQSEATALYDR